MLLTVMFTEPILSPPGWNLILRPERPNLEAGSTRWRATTCHFEILHYFGSQKAKIQKRAKLSKAHSSSDQNQIQI